MKRRGSAQPFVRAVIQRAAWIVPLLVVLGLVALPGALGAQTASPAPAAGAGGRTIEIILDASGSMTAKLPDGTTKIDAAKTAVEKLASALPADTKVALRAYGHGSPKEKHDCKDTELLVQFGSAGEVRDKVVSKARSLNAQGYTPITFVLQTAAGDFPAGAAGERVIVLVSDGKETCEGDPCAAAAALAKSGAKVLIHTVGFGVDEATRGQLACIAKMTGGQYFDAGNAGELADVLGKAVRTSATMVIEDTRPGRLQIKGADLSGHKVTDAQTGKEAGFVSSLSSSLTLPAGIYNVTFGPVVWKSVEVKAGETTVLKPGALKVHNASLMGHNILDSETGEEVGDVSSLKDSAALLPGTYDVTFGSKAVWRGIVVKEGETTTLEPGTVQLKGAGIPGNRIFAASGEEVGDVSATLNWMPLPPGDYAIEIGGKKHPFTLAVGQDLVIEKR